MTIAENDNVITDDGRRGVVSYLKGDSARVVFADGTKKTILLRKLRCAPAARQPFGVTLDDGAILTSPPVLRAKTLDEIATEHGLVRASELRPVPKEKPWRSRAYLEYVRSHPCCACGASANVQASHHGPHGVATKPGDERAVPLCATCHLGEYHQRGTLPGRTREETDELVERVAVELCVPWLLARGAHTAVLRALASAVRERSAA